MKKFNLIVGTIIYLIVWLITAFSIGMSHSAHNEKFAEKINEYYFVIIVLEILVYLILSLFSKRYNNDVGAGIALLMPLGLYGLMPWQIVQFALYGHGYSWLYKTGMDEAFMVILVALTPLLLLHLAIGFEDKMYKKLFGEVQKNEAVND